MKKSGNQSIVVSFSFYLNAEHIFVYNKRERKVASEMNTRVDQELDFAHLLTVKTEPILIFRTYIFIALAKKILISEQQSFLKRNIQVTFPEAYVKVIQQALIFLERDLLQTQAVMAKRNMRVNLRPKIKADRTYTYACWLNGKILYTGGASNRLKTEVMRYVQFYLNGGKGAGAQ